MQWTESLIRDRQTIVHCVPKLVAPYR